MKKRYVVLAAFVAIIGIGWATSSVEENRLSELREADFPAYLAEIKQNDPQRYMQELETYDRERWINNLKLVDIEKWEQIAAAERPGEYSSFVAEREATRRAEIQKLDAEVADIPAAQIDDNLRIYRKLVQLAPDNSRYVSKRDHYAALVADRDWVAKNCSLDQNIHAVVRRAEDVVRRSLKSPRSAKFPGYGERVNKTGDCRFVVSSYVDAQNGFGALIQSEYVVQLEGARSGWKATEIAIY